MNPPPADSPQHQDIPDAFVPERRGISLVWLIPIVAAVIGIWLGVTTILAEGPEISMAFETAEGLEAGKTQIKYRDVTIGVVDTIEISDDRGNIIVTANMEQHAEQYLTKDAKFWVVKPRLDAGGISGLSTLVSGAYIEIEPGKGEPARKFVGLEIPPILDADTPGGKFVLVTKTLASLNPHSPLYYRGIRVGEILGHKLAENKRHLRVHAFVREPFHKLVREDTRFWNVSGIEVKAGAEGLTVKMQSLQALLAGGVAFESLTPESGKPQAKNGRVFQLFNSRIDVQESQITETTPYLLHFDDSVRGLSVNAPVEFRGLRVGSVSDIRFQIDYRTRRIRIAVTIAIEPQRLTNIDKIGEKGADLTRDSYAGMRSLVEQGLRAQLHTGSLLTGKQLISLDIHPDRPNRKLIMSGKHPEIPTIPSTINQITESATRILAKFEKLPLDVLANDLRTAIRSANGVLTEAKQLIVSVENDAGPLVRDLRDTTVAAKKAVVRAEKTLETIDNLAGERSDVRQQLTLLLQELTDTSRSIKELAAYLEQHPESLMRGKPGESR